MDKYYRIVDCEDDGLYCIIKVSNDDGNFEKLLTKINMDFYQSDDEAGYYAFLKKSLEASAYDIEFINSKVVTVRNG